jgi:phage terminase large subunit GpA-like protein
MSHLDTLDAAFDGSNELLVSWLQGLKPPPDLLVSEWADQKRVLDKPFTKVRTIWNTSKVPYMREPMDVLSARSPVRRVSMMKGAQVSGSETGNNWVGYLIDQSPGLTMVVLPTIKMAERMSVRIQAMIDTSADLTRKVKPARSRDSGNTKLMKAFAGGLLVFVGANSGPSLRSYACQNVFIDEADGFIHDVDGEGPPIQVVEARTFGQGDRYKIYVNSTPKIEQTSVINKEWLNGDQRKFFMPCPRCGKRMVYDFALMRLDAPGRYDTVWHECPSGCGERIVENLHKTDMMAAGRWIPKAIWADEARMAAIHAGDFTDLEEFNKTALERSYHLPGLYSPIGWMSWRRVMRLWDEAQGSPGLLKSFRNTVLGLPWLEVGEAPDWEELLARAKTSSLVMRQVPEWVTFLAAGIDVGQDHIEVSVYGFGRRRRRHLVDHIRINGELLDQKLWERLDDFCDRRYLHPTGAVMTTRRNCIDRNKWPHIVDVWLTRKDRSRFTGVRGDDRIDIPFKWSGHKTQRSDGSVSKIDAMKWARAGVSHLKLELFKQLHLKPDDDGGTPAGYVSFPSDVTADWLKQLTSERLVFKTKNGRPYPTWEEDPNLRHEALDCTNYARTAAAIEGWDDWTDLEFEREEKHLAEIAAQLKLEMARRNLTDVASIVAGLVSPRDVSAKADIVAMNRSEPAAPPAPAAPAQDRPGPVPLKRLREEQKAKQAEQVQMPEPEIVIAGYRRPPNTIPMPNYIGMDEDDD